MAKVFFDSKGVKSLESIDCEEDLVLGPGVHVNPPPKEGRCECCLRPISQLKPFGKAGYPMLSDDYDGALLVKTFRHDCPWDEETNKELDEACKCYKNDGYENLLDWLVDKYGQEKGEKLNAEVEVGYNVWSSWECRDCIALTNDEHFERQNQAWNERRQVLSDNYDASNCS